LQQF